MKIPVLLSLLIICHLTGFGQGESIENATSGNLFDTTKYAPKILSLIDRPSIKADTFYKEGEYLKYRKTAGGRIKRIELNELYSIADSGGKEEIFYRTDSSTGNYYSGKEMQDYMTGQQNAFSGYGWMANSIATVGFATGFGGAVSSPFGILSVGIYPAIISLMPVPHVRNSKSRMKCSKTPPYKLGYRTNARKMAVRRSFFAATAGFILGTIYHTSINK